MIPLRPNTTGKNIQCILLLLAWASALTGLICGCAFDLVQVKQMPVTLAQVGAVPKTFVLNEPAAAHIGTGFPVNLKANTKWVEIGVTQYGIAYTSGDQLLTVEASNIHEAALVMRDAEVSGFYLLVEKKFCPATKKTILNLTQK